MRYMIHACPQRMWYVNEFLIPSMKAQGITDDEIIVWNDTEGKGNLFACMESFQDCDFYEGGTWHLQDDVIICSDFAKRTREITERVVCGFACHNFGPSMQYRGERPPLFMWYSFQCIHIPNHLAGECADWFYRSARHYPKFREKVADRKHDDYFWREFLLEKHPDEWVINLTPNLVDHIDYLIGGTLINKLRAKKVNRAEYWEEDELVTQLEEKLKNR